MNTVRPFIKWVGGKYQLLPEIEKRLPLEFNKMDTYIEPFVGGAVLFYVLSNYSNIKNVIINDLNTNLINVYYYIKNNPNDLISLLRSLQTDYTNTSDRKGMFEFYRSCYNNYDSLSIYNSIIKASWFIFLNKTGFNGLYRENKSGSFNVPHGKNNPSNICNEENILETSRLLNSVNLILLNGSYDVVEPYINDNCFMYLDPPYREISSTSSFNNYTKNGFTDKDQTNLKNWLDKLNCKWLESNSFCDDNFFNNLYSNYLIEKVSAKRVLNSNSSKRGDVFEILIKNY